MKIQENVSLSGYTTFRVGGPAKYFVEVTSVEELKEALKYAQENKLDFFVMGGGSNILVSDKGFDGLAVKMKIDSSNISEETIDAGAGVSLAKIIRDSIEAGLTGLEWASGIPGTLGGAIRGNAGAYGGEIKDIIQNVAILEFTTSNSQFPIQFQIKNYNSNDCLFSYRNSIFKQKKNIIILSAVLKLKKGDREESQKKAQEIISARIKKMPQEAQSAGSFFVNPIVQNEKLVKEFEEETGVKSKNGKVPAGWLIEKVGLRGKKVGGAMVNEIHPNYVLNVNSASAEDIIILSSIIKQKVRTQLGVQLKEEVQLIGF